MVLKLNCEQSAVLHEKLSNYYIHFYNNQCYCCVLKIVLLVKRTIPNALFAFLPSENYNNVLFYHYIIFYLQRNNIYTFTA